MITAQTLTGATVEVLPNLPAELKRLAFEDPHQLDELIGTTQYVYNAFPATHEGVWPPAMDGQYTQWEDEAGNGVFLAEVDLGCVIPSTSLRIVTT
jgi:hypothetical protein